MADESDLEKTEAASPRRLEKAREEGDVPRSRELGTFTVLLAATLGLWITGDAVAQQLKQLMRHALDFQLATVLDWNQLAIQWRTQGIELLLSFTPMVLLLVLAAVGSPLLIGGWIMSGKAVTPDFGKLNPMRGLGKMVSIGALSELLKALAKTALVALATWFVISTQYDKVLALTSQTMANGSIKRAASRLPTSATSKPSASASSVTVALASASSPQMNMVVGSPL